uniref:Uncharacterized protein n=1 Tax=Nelumbo nucifera TaxID=4432 RepID=A0A822ZGH3_NELNU|nr:TPA_asm: hypothetical protein HUJ06_001923 [Nelumbo nucifera]
MFFTVFTLPQLFLLPILSLASGECTSDVPEEDTGHDKSKALRLSLERVFQ